MNTTPELQNGASTLDTLDWEKGSTVEVRKALAKHFEKFLLANMDAGRVEPEKAQDTASAFVRIFESALTPDTLNSAFDTLSHEKNALLQNFSLRVEEMRRKQVSLKLYEFMDYLILKGEIALARQFFKMYADGEITSSTQMEALIDQHSLQFEVSEVQKKLMAVGLKQQSEELTQALANNRIQRSADLAPWLSVVAGIQMPVTTDQAKGIAAPLQASAGLLQKATTFLHRFDKTLRKGIGTVGGKKN